MHGRVIGLAQALVQSLLFQFFQGLNLALQETLESSAAAFQPGFYSSQTDIQQLIAERLGICEPEGFSGSVHNRQISDNIGDNFLRNFF